MEPKAISRSGNCEEQHYARKCSSLGRGTRLVESYVRWLGRMINCRDRVGRRAVDDVPIDFENSNSDDNRTTQNPFQL